MKQIEDLPAAVLCATLVLPCSTLCPREIRPRRTRPRLARLDGKQARRAKPSGVPSCQSFQRARRLASSSFERNSRSAT